MKNSSVYWKKHSNASQKVHMTRGFFIHKSDIRYYYFVDNKSIKYIYENYSKSIGKWYQKMSPLKKILYTFQ